MVSKRRKYTGWSKRIERNILTVYLQANEQDREAGLYWYQHANETAQALAVKFGYTIEQTAGVIAALSPGNNWGRNVIDAELLIERFAAGARGHALPSVGSYGYRNILKAARILLGHESQLEVLGGDKVRSFYWNILDPKDESQVTIDRHAKALAYNRPSARNGFASSNTTVTHAEYGYLTKHYRNIAERLGLIPNQLQAITWVTWKRLEGKIDESNAPF